MKVTAWNTAVARHTLNERDQCIAVDARIVAGYVCTYMSSSHYPCTYYTDNPILMYYEWIAYSNARIIVKLFCKNLNL